MASSEADDLSWEEEVELSKKPVIVMFYSPTCPHCAEVEPHFEEYSEEYAGMVSFIKLDVTSSIFTARRYGVMATPTFKFFCGGRPVGELVGAPYPQLLKKEIDEILLYSKECSGKSTPVRYDPAYV